MSKYHSLNDALTKYKKKTDKGSELDREYEAFGTPPDQLINHATASDVISHGLTPKQVEDLYGSAQFDIYDLLEQFSLVCHDYKTPIL